MLDHVGLAYSIALLGGFTAVAVWETLRPLRRGTVPVAGRWRQNFLLFLIDQAVVAAMLPLLAVGAALYAQSHGWGLLAATGLPGWLTFCLGIVALDLARWSIHFSMHRFTWLWRLHRMHHSDLDYDLTTGMRFHPAEAVINAALYVGAVLVLGVPPLAALASEVLTIALGLVVHANASLPGRVDAGLRLLFVTPDVHRIHHSAQIEEAQSNFGSVLTVWDRLFGSYRDQPQDGPLEMTVGLADLRDPQQLTLWRLLTMPWCRSSAPAPLTRARRAG